MTIKQQGGIFGRNPTFNDLTVEGTISVPNDSITGNAINGGTAALDGLSVDTNTLYVDAANNATLVGTSTWNTTYDPRFQVEGTAGDGTQGILVSSYKPSVTFFDFSGGTPAVHRIAADSGKLSFEIDTAQNGTFTEAFCVSAAGNIAMASGKGIDFSATSGTGTSELFDDYEEGTWTPTFGNLTLGDGTSTGTYTKIGDTVTIYGKLVLGSTTTVDGTLSVTNLPFSAASGFNPIGNMRLLDQGTNSFAAQVSVNTTSLTFRSAVANSTYLLWGQVNATTPFTWVATDQIEFNAVYKAA